MSLEISGLTLTYSLDNLISDFVKCALEQMQRNQKEEI